MKKSMMNFDKTLQKFDIVAYQQLKITKLLILPTRYRLVMFHSWLALYNKENPLHHLAEQYRLNLTTQALGI